MKIMDMIKDSKAVIALAVIMIGVIGKTYVWASDVSKAVEKMAETQEMVQQSEIKLRDFIFDLWKIDPKVRDKWVGLPDQPDSTDEFAPWYEFEVNGLLKYQVILDSLKPHNKGLMVDTIYWHKW